MNISPSKGCGACVTYTITQQHGITQGVMKPTYGMAGYVVGQGRVG